MARGTLRPAVGVAILLSAASSCSTSPSQPVALLHPSSPGSTVFGFPSASQFSLGETPAEQLVISDATAWTDLWSRLVSRDSPAPDPPVVDFSQNLVLFTTMGAEPSSGFDTSIEGATEEAGGRLVVQITETSPGPTCGVSTAFTYPVDAVTVPRTVALHIEFNVTKTVRNCGS